MTARRLSDSRALKRGHLRSGRCQGFFIGPGRLGDVPERAIRRFDSAGNFHRNSQTVPYQPSLSDPGLSAPFLVARRNITKLPAANARDNRIMTP